MKKLSIEDVLKICKRRGVFSSSCSIYGGLPGVFDYGPVGAEIKTHLRRAWWEAVVYGDYDVHGIEAGLLTPPLLHEYSGFLGANYDEFGVFKSHIKNDLGLVSACHLRVTTAQHSFANFDNIVNSEHPLLPFGIAQIGKAFRNEQQTTNYPVRMREFEQMELQFFVPKNEAVAWHELWLSERVNWWERQGVSIGSLVIDDVAESELAHYSSKTYDIHYKLQDGELFEIEGIANRGDFDCASHSAHMNELTTDSIVAPNKMSNALMAIKTPGSDMLTVPYVIEPAAGVDRGLMAILFDSFFLDDTSAETSRIVLKIKPHLAPIKACIYVSSVGDSCSMSLARSMRQRIQKISRGKVSVKVGCNLDELIKYNDEVGTPKLIILDDYLSMDKIVTVRDRDTAKSDQMSLGYFYETFSLKFS